MFITKVKTNYESPWFDEINKGEGGGRCAYKIENAPTGLRTETQTPAEEI